MQQQPTLYIVDDDEAVRDALSLVGAVLGLAVATYGSARTFLDAYDPAKPGPLILDLRMPGMSGLELQHELEVRGVHIPTILITGHGEGHEARRALAAGAIAVLQKPFDIRVLSDRIRQAIAQLGR